VPDADPNQAVIDARANLKDTAKWIVTILGATIVLVIGGGLIGKIADLDWPQRALAALSLLAVAALCLPPLQAAAEIVASRLTSFRYMVDEREFARTRVVVNNWLRDEYPPELHSVQNLYDQYMQRVRIVNDGNRPQAVRDQAQAELDELQPYVNETVELLSTEFLRLKFDRLVHRTMYVLPFMAAALFGFLVFIHTDDQTEKQLARPMFLQIPWSADVETALKEAGLEQKCYAPDRPQLLQVSEKSGLRAGVLVIPKDLGPACPVVRVIVTDTDQVYPDK
jgi:hypothetical protein